MHPVEGAVSKISKAERQMNLVSMLLASRVPVPLSSILGSVSGYDDADAPRDTLEKRFDRDRKELRAIGLDVEYHPLDDGIGGYTIDRRKNMQRPLKLAPAEAALLAIAGRIGAAATGGGALHEALKSALRKLAVDTPVDDGPEDSLPLVVSRERREDAPGHRSIEMLANAVAEHRTVRFLYASGSGETTRSRNVTPWGLGLALGAWYVVGWCHAKKDVRVFKLVRIEGEVEIAGDVTPIPRPRDFVLKDHLPVLPYDVGRGERERVVLRLKGAREAQAFDAALSPRVLRRDDDGLVIELRVRHPEGFVPWILTASGDVEALEPATLRTAVRAAAMQALDAAGKEDAP